MTLSYLPIAVRAFTDRQKPRYKSPYPTPPKWPLTALAIDTETTTDERLRLIFGCYRICRWQTDGTLVCREEGLFYDDDLSDTDALGFANLREYVAAHNLVATRRGTRSLRFLSRRAFLDRVFYRMAVQARSLVVGFNLPFDLSRLAFRASPARGRRRSGISLAIFETRDPKDGAWRENGFRPRIVIQSQDSKRAFIELTRVQHVDRDEMIPDGATDGQPVPGYRYGGRFLDLRTLTFALTGKSHSLRSAIEAFGASVQKRHAERHGSISPEYIDYARGDVEATESLLAAVRSEFDRHPVQLAPDRAYSPAAIAKAYLRAMEVSPLVDRSALSMRQLGAAMSAYYGGRAEVRIRRTPVPVRYCDFTSMYPTVNALMNMWAFLTAERIEVEDATERVQRLLSAISLAACFEPSFWPALSFFARVQPDGDIFPVRAQYGVGDAYTIGVNPLTSPVPLRFTGPDLVASVLLTGRVPNVIEAFSLVAVGQVAGLTPVKLGGSVEIDPRTNDLFRSVIEERKRLDWRTDLSSADRARIGAYLKIFANAGCYGILAEMNRQPRPAGKPATVTVFGPGEPFDCSCQAPEEPGAYCYPPVAALITGAARLMLALLESCVTDAGGAYAMCDTDSMAIVANERGGLVPCEGGPADPTNRTGAIRALTWAAVDEIVDRFEALNPYDRTAVPGSILRMEPVNFDESGNHQPIECFAISAKRYALFTRLADGSPVVLPNGFSEHGLGVLLDPTADGADIGSAPDRPREWIRQVWSTLLRDC